MQHLFLPVLRRICLYVRASLKKVVKLEKKKSLDRGGLTSQFYMVNGRCPEGSRQLAAGSRFRRGLTEHNVMKVQMKVQQHVGI